MWAWACDHWLHLLLLNPEVSQSVCWSILCWWSSLGQQSNAWTWHNATLHPFADHFRMWKEAVWTTGDDTLHSKVCHFKVAKVFFLPQRDATPINTIGEQHGFQCLQLAMGFTHQWAMHCNIFFNLVNFLFTCQPQQNMHLFLCFSSMSFLFGSPPPKEPQERKWNTKWIVLFFSNGAKDCPFFQSSVQSCWQWLSRLHS